MRRPLVGLLGLTLVCGTVTAVGTSASAIAPTKAHGPSAVKQGPHDLPNPLGDKQRALRSEAVQQVLSGETTTSKRGVSTVAKIGAAADSTPADARSRRLSRGHGGGAQYVELSREATDKVFVILVEFGNQRHPDYPDSESVDAQRFDGPLHNQIPKPGVADNSTVWQGAEVNTKSLGKTTISSECRSSPARCGSSGSNADTVSSWTRLSGLRWPIVTLSCSAAPGDKADFACTG